MEVGEVRDTHPVELGCQPRNLHVDRAEPHPAGLEPAPAEQRRGGSAQAADDAREHPETLEMARAQPKPGPKPPLQPIDAGGRRHLRYTASLSSTGFIETTCRLNLSSESSRPAATPINCERCMIGIGFSGSRPSLLRCAFSFDCHASRDK